jgi:hypothetical protein
VVSVYIGRERGTTDVCINIVNGDYKVLILHPRLWLILTAVTLLVDTDVDFILTDTFPAILGISNTLIHARVGLGWSPNSSITGEVCRSCCLVRLFGPYT